MYGLWVRAVGCAVLLGVSVSATLRGAEQSAKVIRLPSPSRIVVRLTPHAAGHQIVKVRKKPPSAKLLGKNKHSRKTCSGDHHDKSRVRSRLHNGTAIPFGVTKGFAATCDHWGIDGVKPLYSHKFMNPEAARRMGLDRTFVIDVPPGVDPRVMAAEFAKLSDDVETASVDAIGMVAQFIPDDALFDRQYGMNNTGQSISLCPAGAGVPDADVDAPEAWEIHTGDIGTVTIAIIDTGVTPHVEFTGRMVPGINTLDSMDPNDTDDDCPHGTHVAGIAAAQGGNGIGVAGMTWGANIMPVKVLINFGFGCGGSATDVAEGIVWAVDHGADICNVSIQFCGSAPGEPGWDAFVAMEAAVDYAHENDVLVVSAAGNTSFSCPGEGDTVRFPAKFANSMAISATNNRDGLSSVSNSGSEVDVTAPGECIWSTLPNDISPFLDYGPSSGTSFSTPHVSGLAALLKSLDPTLTNTELRDLITSTADDLGTEGRDPKFGFGRINAHSAVLQAGDPRILSSDPPNGAIDARQPFQPDDSATFSDYDVWRKVDLTFPASTTGLTTADFSISEDPATGDKLFVLAVFPIGNICQVFFNRPISALSWTTVTHLDSGTSVRLGFLPGDTNGDGMSTLEDILVASEALAGEVGPLPIWSVDLNRSGTATARDLLRSADLLGGVVGVYDPFLGSSLPP